MIFKEWMETGMDEWPRLRNELFKGFKREVAPAAGPTLFIRCKK